jgi:hypothetical protein
MSLFRLLSSSLTIAIIATTLVAQSSPTEKTAVAGTSPLARAGEVDQPLQPRLPGSDGPRECLKMRMYKIRRDEPQSDSTHLVGYSTCLPVARIQTYGVAQPLPVKMP